MMTPIERRDYAIRFLCQRFAELTVETPGKVSFLLKQQRCAIITVDLI